MTRGMAKKPSPDDLRKLKDRAAEAAGKGRFEKAAELYREAADGDPRDIGTRQKLADALRRAGRIPAAIQAYQAVADRFGKDGLLIKAIAISKTILELDPEHVETQAALADLYAKRAKGEGARPARAGSTPRPLPGRAEAGRSPEARSRPPAPRASPRSAPAGGSPDPPRASRRGRRARPASRRGPDRARGWSSRWRWP